MMKLSVKNVLELYTPLQCTNRQAHLRRPAARLATQQRCVRTVGARRQTKQEAVKLMICYVRQILVAQRFKTESSSTEPVLNKNDPVTTNCFAAVRG